MVELSAYPNPVLTSTKIRFATMQKGQVSVMVYDHTGRNVETIYDGVRESGNHEFVWTPEALANGVYFAKIKADGQMQTLKLVLNK
jgi:hypothetical protein